MKKIKYFAFAGLFALLSCTDDSLKEIGSDLLKNPNFETGVFTATISVSNIKEKKIQTNALKGYLLGKYTQEPFATKKASIISQVVLPSVNPTFGLNSQANEESNKKPENEKVTEVFLYIPFFNANSSLTNPSYTADTHYKLDSIYGNGKATFDLKVNELNYFLRDIDNDLKNQVYYSDLDVSAHLGASLIDVATNYSVNDKSITRYKFDDPRTSEDESKTPNDVLAPGLRIRLKNDFFQNKIIDMEGKSELSSANAFKNYFRGIAISADNFSWL